MDPNRSMADIQYFYRQTTKMNTWNSTKGNDHFVCVPGQFSEYCAGSWKFPLSWWKHSWDDFLVFDDHRSVRMKKKIRSRCFVNGLKANESTHFHLKVSTFKESWSSLSATFPTANRISVLCCRASVIRKVVTSPGPGGGESHIGIDWNYLTT